MEGWVKIHRKIRDNWIWDNPDYLKAWLDLIFRANFEEKRILFDGEVKELKCGQFVTSVRKLAESWAWSNSRVLNFLKMLEADGMITRESNSKRTLLSIENYEVYQVVQNTNENADDNTSKNASTIQKRKKEEKNEIITPEDEKRLIRNFGKILEICRRESGRQKAFERYKKWVTTGREVNGKIVVLTDKQIWQAIKRYNIETEGLEIKYLKPLDLLLGNAILDYVEWSELHEM